MNRDLTVTPSDRRRSRCSLLDRAACRNLGSRFGRLRGPWFHHIPKRGLILGLLLLSLALVALLAPWLAPADPNALVAPPLTAPDSTHWLGVDHLGRDVLSRLLFGARWTLGAALLACAVAAVPGILLGLLAGYAEGILDVVVSRALDVLLAFPRLLLALGIVALAGTGMLNVALATGLAGIPMVARILRGNVLVTRRQTYIEAARALGAGDLRLARRHIWPNVAGTAFVLVTLQMGWAILDISALSFLGLGAPLGAPEWGTMLNESRIVLRDAPWVALAPGLALALTVLSINLLGDTVRDVLDPRRVR